MRSVRPTADALPQAERTLELFAEHLLERRIGANEGAHARLRSLLRKAGMITEASNLERAHGRILRDIAANPAYVQAFLKARAALPAGSPRIPAPFPPIAPEAVVHGRTLRMFAGCLEDLTEAYGEERRLMLVTATCPDEARIPWRKRMKEVTERRDAILQALAPHRVWAASIFDVQKGLRGSKDLNPHWHVLFVTDEDRMPDVLKRLGKLHCGAMKVDHCDRDGWVRKGDLLSEEGRMRSWARVLAYCAKAFAACPVTLPSVRWSETLAAVVRERGFRSRGPDRAMAARAAHTVNRVRAKFCKKDAKVKALRRSVAKPKKTVVKALRPRGRPRAGLRPGIIAKVAAGTMSVSEASRILPADRKTVRSHVDAAKENTSAP